MATIQNDRDVILQAALDRTATVSLPPNVSVPVAQVPGLPETVEATKKIELATSSLVFQIAKSGAISPATITLTPFLRNLSGTPTLSVVAGTITGAPPLPLVAGSATLNPANMVTDSVTIRAAVTVNSVTYSQDVTISKVREGLNGLNAVYATLDKDSWTFPCDIGGVVTSYNGGSAKMTIFQGTTDETSLWTLTSANSTGVTAAAVSTAGLVTVTGFNSANDTGNITITATRNTYPTLTRVFNLNKAKPGSNGIRGSMIFYVSTTGTAWSDTLANTTSNVNGGTSLNDQVTQFNNSLNYSETRFWNGSAWVVVNAVIDGNLLVGGTVGASKISVTSLSAISADLGTVTAGTLKTVMILGGDYTGYAWPAAGLKGFYLGPSGLLLGNASGGGKYLQYDSVAGTITTNMALSAATGTFAGALSAATGSFSGTLAANTVVVDNIVGEACTGVRFGENDAGGVGTSVTFSASAPTVVLPSGTPGTIIINVALAWVAGTTVADSLTYTWPPSVTIRRNGGAWRSFKVATDGSPGQGAGFYSASFQDSPGAGSWYYDLVVTTAPQGGSANKMTILVIGAKR